MFYDERIESVKGRITRNAILMSVMIALVLGSLRLANVLRNTADKKYLCLVVLEAVIALGGMICLLIGFMMEKRSIKDERVISKKSSFYNKASVVLIKTVMAALAFFLPIDLHIHIGTHHTPFFDPGFHSTLLVVFFIVGIYVIYGFRRNDIYFNYSIMENEHYYSCVFKNIGRFAVCSAYLFCISAISFVLFVLSPGGSDMLPIRELLTVALIYLCGAIGLSLLYLICSFLERASYNSSRFISKAPIISLAVTIFIYALYTAIVIYADASSATPVSAAQTVSTVSVLKDYICLALLIFLTYFGYEYQKSKPNKLLSAGCITIILCKTLAVLLRQISVCSMNVFTPELVHENGYTVTQIFGTVNISINNLSNIAAAIGFALILIGLIRDRSVKNSNKAAIPIIIILSGIELILHMRADYLYIVIYHSLAEISVLCYFCILTAHINRKQAADIIMLR